MKINKLYYLMIYIVIISLFLMNFISVSAISNLNLTDGCVYVNLQRNDELTKETFKKNLNGYITTQDIKDVSLYIDNNNSSITLSGDLSMTINGQVNNVNNKGFVGVFEGMIDDSTPIIANVTYTEEEAFLTLTIGYLGSNQFENAFYGIYTDKIKEIDQNVVQNVMELQNQMEESRNSLIPSDEFVNEGASLQAVDATIRYKGGSSISYTSGKPVLYLSVFHANQLRNQGVMKIQAKVNTNSKNLREYLLNNVYTDATIVGPQPDTFIVSIKGKHSDLAIIGNSSVPASGTSKLTIPIPYVNLSGTISTENISITKSKVTVKTSKYNTASQNDNVSEWNIYNNFGGWPVAEFDGDKSSKTGMVCKLDMTNQGNVTSNVTRQISCTAKIRFYVNALVGNQMKLYFFTTSTCTANTSVTVVP